MIKHLFAGLVLALSVMLGGCGTSTEDLAKEVRSSMEETFAQDAATRHVQIKDFTLIHEDGKKYKGLLNTVEHGEKFTYSVSVTYDGSTFMWEVQQ